MQGPHALNVSDEAKAGISKLLASDTLPPRDIFAPMLQQVCTARAVGSSRVINYMAILLPTLITLHQLEPPPRSGPVASHSSSSLLVWVPGGLLVPSQQITFVPLSPRPYS